MNAKELELARAYVAKMGTFKNTKFRGCSVRVDGKEVELPDFDTDENGQVVAPGSVILPQREARDA